MDRARDLMTTDVCTIRQDATAGAAIQALLQHRISGMPVVDADSILTGIVSEFQLLEVIFDSRVKNHRVRDLMTKDVLTVDEDSALSDVASLFVVHRIRRVPVLRDGRVVGIIARRDLLGHAMGAADTPIDAPAVAEPL